jgi:predicted ester cyclase
MSRSEEEAIRALGERLYAALDAQDWAAIGQLISADLVVQVGSSAPMGLEQWQTNQKAFYQGFPNGHHVIDDILVDGCRFVTQCRFVGTHTGFFGDLAPSGAAVSVGAIHIDRFENGVLVEHRGQLDMHGLLQQIGTK